MNRVMNRITKRSLNRWTLRALTAAALLLAALSPAEAEQTFKLTTESFADANGNGLIDCGETVNIQAVLFDNNPPVDVPFTGRLTIPSNFPNHFSYASFEEDFVFTNRCQVTNVVRDLPGGGFILDYSCTGLEAPNNGYILALHIHGAYTGPSGTIQFQGTNDVTSPAVLSFNANYLETRTKACPLADLQLTKSDGGISSAPGNTVPYTLTVVNRGNSSADEHGPVGNRARLYEPQRLRQLGGLDLYPEQPRRGGLHPLARQPGRGGLGLSRLRARRRDQRPPLGDPDQQHRYRHILGGRRQPGRQHGDGHHAAGAWGARPFVDQDDERDRGDARARR